MIKYIILIFLTIFFIMAIQTWGGLQKSTTDDETIEQAIGRLISDHESDSSAHLGEGESLQAHKSEDIIDHPALSVVADKITKSSVILDTNFSSLDNLGQTGTVLVSTLDGAVLQVDSPSPSASSLLVESAYFSNLFDYSKNTFFETFAIFPEGVSVNGVIGLISGWTTTSRGWGFQIRSGVLYAYCGNNISYVDYNLSSINIHTAHKYSARYDATAHSVDFYVDDSLVHSLSASTYSTWYTTDSYIAKIGIVSSNFEQLVLKYFYICTDSN